VIRRGSPIHESVYATHRSGHHDALPYWEILNEPDIEHKISRQDYILLYDAIVTAIRQVSPKTRFVGPPGSCRIEV
jgi:hypothetical protein